MKELLLNELEEELQRLKELKEMWGKNNLHDDYLEGRLSAMEQVIDFIKQLELKLIFNELQKEILKSKELKGGIKK